MLSTTAVKSNTFALVHDRLQRSFKNQAFKERPYNQSDRRLRELLFNLGFTIEAQLNVLNDLKAEDMEEVTGRMFENCHVDCLLEGNLSADEATGALEVTTKALCSRST